MKTYNIQNFGLCKISNIILDLNGTINFFGKRPDELLKYITKLKEHFKIFIISANIRGDLPQIAEELSVNYKQIQPSNSDQEGKLKILMEIGADESIVVGNGNNDVKTLSAAKIGIAVIGLEGASINAILAADIIVTNPIDAFKIILDEKAMNATLRK